MILYIRNSDGTVQEFEVTQDMIIQPQQGQQFFFDHNHGNHYFNLSNGEKDVDLFIQVNGETIKVTFANYVNLLVGNGEANANNITAITVALDKEGSEEIQEVLANTDFSGGDLIARLKVLLAQSDASEINEEGISNGVIIDDFASLTSSLEDATAGGETQGDIQPVTTALSDNNIQEESLAPRAPLDAAAAVGTDGDSSVGGLNISTITFSISATPTIYEDASSGIQTAVFSITQSSAIQEGESVTLSLGIDQTAIGGLDYTPSLISAIASAAASTVGVTYDVGANTLTFDSNYTGTSFDVSITVVDDNLEEVLQSITLNIDGVSSTSLVNAQLAETSAKTDIVSDDVSRVDTISFDVVDEDDPAGVLTHDIHLTNPAEFAKTYDIDFRHIELFDSISITEEDYLPPVFTNGVTYDAQAGTITVPAFVTDFTMTVGIINDNIDENLYQLYFAVIDEVFTFGLILDDDRSYVDTISDATVNEGGQLVHSVELTNPADHDNTFRYRLTNLSTEINDYDRTPVFSNGVTLSESGRYITVPAFVTSFTVTYDTVDDNVDEFNEQYRLDINYVRTTGTIIDDDTARVESISSASVVEGGSIVHNVVLSNPAEYVKTYAVAFTNISASSSDYITPIFGNGVTYNAHDNTISVPVGVSVFSVIVPTVNDTVDEAFIEKYRLTIDGVSNIGKIIDDDDISVESVTSQTGTEGSTLIHSVILSGVSEQARDYNFSITNLTTQDEDYNGIPTFTNGVTYNAAEGLITVPANIESFTVSIESTQDDHEEIAEQYQLNVHGVSAIGSITNDDDTTVEAIGVASGYENEEFVHTVTMSNLSDVARTYSFSISGEPVNEGLSEYVTTAGTDFDSIPTFSNGVTYDVQAGTITVPPNTASFTVTVDVFEDNIQESIWEIYQINIDEVQSIGVMLNSDRAEVESISEGIVSEGENIVHTVTLTGPADFDKGFYFVMTDLSTQSNDYGNLILSNGVTFEDEGRSLVVPAYVTSFTITVPTTEDSVSELSENYSLRLGGVTVLGTILNDDTTITTPSVADITAVEEGTEYVASEDEAGDGVNPTGDLLSVAGLSIAQIGFGAQTAQFPSSTSDGSGSYVTLDSAHGTLKVYANGSYEFTVNENSDAVNALGVGDSLTNTFYFVATNGSQYGTPVSFDVEIQGANDSPQINVLQSATDIGLTLGDEQTFTAAELLSSNVQFSATNGNLLINTGSGGADIAVNYAGSNAAFQNIVGFYVEDEQGNPSDPVILYVDDGTANPDNPVFLRLLENVEGQVGFFILPNGANNAAITESIANGDSLEFNDRNQVIFRNDDGDLSSGSSRVYFSNNAFSTDRSDHAVAAEADDGVLTIGFEDLSAAGDRDYDDFVFTVQLLKTFEQNNFLIDNVDLNDFDNTHLQSATLTLTNYNAGDTFIPTQFPGHIVLSGNSVVDGDLVLTLVGSATVAEYEEALEAIRFTATSNSETDRTFELVVNDGEKVSNTQTFSLYLGENYLNAIPTSTDDSITLNEDTRHVLTLQDFGTYTDDNTNSFREVQLTSLPNNGVIFLSGVAVSVGAIVSVADVANGNLVFAPYANSDADGSFGYKVGDGNSFSEEYTNTITVNPIEDPGSELIRIVTNESEQEGSTLIHSVILSGVSEQARDYNFSITNLTTQDEDYNGIPTFTNGVTYNAAEGLITVPANIESFTVSIESTQDDHEEIAEQYQLNVHGVSAIGSITNDDDTTVEAIGVASGYENEEFVHTVTMSNLSDVARTYSFSISGEPVNEGLSEYVTTAGTDFDSIPTFSNGVTYDVQAGTITVPPNTASFTVTVDVFEDNIQESIWEIYQINIDEVQSIGVMLNSDRAEVESISEGIVSEGENIVHTVTLTGPADFDKGFYFVMTDLSTQSNDYGNLILSNGVTFEDEGRSLVVPAYVTSFTITVPTTEDSVSELSENYSLRLGGVTVLGTILNDDTTITTPSVADITAVEEGTEYVASEDEAGDGVNPTGDLLSVAGLSIAQIGFGAQTAQFPSSTSDGSGSYVTLDSAHGTLKVYANGSYEFTVNENSDAVNALGVGDSLTNTFYFVATNGSQYGTPVSFDVEIQGANDSPQINVLQSATDIGLTLGDEQTFTAAELLSSNVQFSATNGNLLINTGSGGADIAVNYAGSNAAFQNIVGFYVEDEQGNPSDPVILYVDDGTANPDNPVFLRLLENVEGQVGFFILPNGANNAAITESIANGDSLEFNDRNQVIFRNDDGDLSSGSSRVYFSNNAFSTDRSDHAVAAEADDGVLTIGFEDLSAAGDRDYDDFVFTVQLLKTFEQNNFLIDNVDLNDFDNTHLQSATLTLTNYNAGDTFIPTQFPGHIVLSGNSVVDGDLVLTLVGSATVAEYEEALEAIRFTATSNSETDRTFELVVNDGEKVSNTQTFSLYLGENYLNAIPTSTDDSITLNEDTRHVLTLQDFGTYTDDNTNSFREVQLTSLPNNGVIFLSGVAVSVGAIVSVADVANGNLVFAPYANSDADGSFGYKVGDGNSFSEEYTNTITVNPEADEINLNAEISNVSIESGSRIYTLDINANLQDTDSSEAITSIVVGNVPSDSVLIGATPLGDGNWSVSVPNNAISFNETLLITQPEGSSNTDFELRVAATSSEDNDVSTLTTMLQEINDVDSSRLPYEGSTNIHDIVDINDYLDSNPSGDGFDLSTAVQNVEEVRMDSQFFNQLDVNSLLDVNDSDTASLDLFVQESSGNNVNLSNNQFESAGTHSVDGETYNVYQGTGDAANIKIYLDETIDTTQGQ